MARNYKKEYENYHSSEKQKKRRAKRNAARRKLEREGRVRKGDGKDVHHVDHRGLTNNSHLLKVQSKKKNRSFPRNKKAQRA